MYDYGSNTVSSSKRGIQYDVVAAIAGSLLAQGFKPEEISAGAIREETGTGSLTTIIAHLKRWRDRLQPAEARVELTSDDLAPIAGSVATLINEASQRAREEERKAYAPAAAEAARVRAQFDEALALNEDIEADLVAARAEAATLREEVEKARIREAHLQGQLEAQARELARLERAAERRASDVPGTDSATPEPEQQTDDLAARRGTSGAATGEELAAVLASVTDQHRRSASADNDTPGKLL